MLEQASDDGRKFVFSACKTLNFHENLLELRRSGTGGGRIVMLKFFQAGNGPFVIVARAPPLIFKILWAPLVAPGKRVVLKTKTSVEFTAGTSIPN